MMGKSLFFMGSISSERERSSNHHAVLLNLCTHLRILTYTCGNPTSKNIAI